MPVESNMEDTWFGQEANEKMRRSVQALYRLHRLIPVMTDLDALLERITEESRDVAHAEASSVMLFDPGSDELYFHVAIGDSGDQEVLKREIRLKLGQGIAGAAAETRASINVEDAQTDPRFFPDADAAINFQTRNLLAVPMLDRGDLIGVLEVVNHEGGGAFSSLDVQVMEIFSSLAATSVVNARLFKEHVRNERLAAIGQAVTGLSHYTKNIVTGLSSSADLIDMGLESDNVDVLRRGWPIFKRSTERISNFVQDMLSYSKPRVPVREECSLAGIVQDAVETFGELFARKNVDLQLDLDQAGHPLWVEGQAIYRCLLNLLTNAADAVPNEGGQILLSARQGVDGVTAIDVGDNGPGVPDKYRVRIFDPFFSTKGASGTGLGLAVTQKIAREHGGEINVLDSPQGGALFRMTIPPGPAKEKEDPLGP